MHTAITRNVKMRLDSLIMPIIKNDRVWKIKDECPKSG